MIPVGEDRPTPMSTTEAGRKGGSAVRDKYGEDYYRRIGKKGGAVLKEKRGTEYYRTIAKKGGNANMAKNGIDHFSQMGKKGGIKESGAGTSISCPTLFCSTHQTQSRVARFGL